MRHTVGLGDPLRAVDIHAAERLHDGLPHALDESIRAYGLTYFKIKVCGQPQMDLPRLRENKRLRKAAVGHSRNMVAKQFFHHFMRIGIAARGFFYRSKFLEFFHCANSIAT